RALHALDRKTLSTRWRLELPLSSVHSTVDAILVVSDPPSSGAARVIHSVDPSTGRTLARLEVPCLWTSIASGKLIMQSADEPATDVFVKEDFFGEPLKDRFYL